ncbi:MAG: DEAD/DEAH box helicase [Anaerolineaceae bacterium]|nr:DEAD/DEAH box helicase [Anaerolineaceae bacterium]
MNFNQFNLDARLNAGIRREGFHTPTPIQESAIPLALAGQDLIGTAQTGTGKTAAFVLPILHKLLTGPRKRTRALIITPTRELAEQIHQVMRSLSRGTHIRSVTVYGGVGAAKQIEALHRGVEIVVACPGRLLDHIQKKHAKLGNIEILVLDEADRMLDMGFLPDIKRILKHVPSRRQTMLFSATFPKEIEHLAAQTMHNPKRVAIGLARPVHTVAHTLYPVPQHLKRKLLTKLLKQTETKSVLVFTRTKHRAQRLAKQLAHTDYKVTSLHGNRTQNQRTSALKGFKAGTYQIMVATDIAARGLDIDRISHVINYDMPDTADAYIHRIGRTGRAKRTGEAFTLVTPDDNVLIRKIEKIMKQKLHRQTLPDFDYEVPKPDYPQTSRKTKPRASQRTHSHSRQRAYTR